MAYWLMKSEPDVFGITHLERHPQHTEHWDGVRNYQARNFIRDKMSVGDRIFFYHSNCKKPGIVGIAEVASAPYPDHTAFDPESRYYDPKSTPDNPRWFMVDVKFVRHLKRTITLQELKDHDKALQDFALLKKGNRLSVMPVSEDEWEYIIGLE